MFHFGTIPSPADKTTQGPPKQIVNQSDLAVSTGTRQAWRDGSCFIFGGLAKTMWHCLKSCRAERSTSKLALDTRAFPDKSF